jgi:hypothetical protein
MRPVIVLAFSNDRDDYLPMITRERKNIFKTLQDHHDSGYVQVHKEESTTLEDLFWLFNRYRDRIVIFHYGGHAGSTCLQLESSAGEPQTAHAVGLAQLLGQQKQLQLVFLNGCATLKQVELLLSAGVGAVIATSVPIQDEMATEFAEQFYEALAGQAAIQEAFETAKAFITTKYGSAKEIIRYYRRALREKIEKTPNGEIPWGLYYDENRPVPEWKLPISNQDSVIIRDGDFSYTADVQVNTRLIETLFNEITRYGVPRPGKMDFRAIRQEVIDSYPAPVGEQLRVLFQGSKTDIPRLKQLVVTYNTMIQLLCFTLLSQLWDDRFKTPALAIHKDYFVEINNFFTLGPGSYLAYDYFKLIEAIAGIFEENEIECFIAEFNTVKESFRAKDEFFKAYLLMEEMKQEVQDDHVNANEIQSFCVQAEEHLGTILKKLAFLVRYKLTTIKRIEVIKRRHKKVEFSHNKVILDRVTAGLEDEAGAYDTYTENNAVILMKDVQDVARYLNLSPLIIDENALTGCKCSKLFFYSHQEIVQGKPCYHYKFSDNPEEKLLVTDSKYPQVKEQFDELKENVFK